MGRALGAADPDTKAACMNAYVAGLVKVGLHRGNRTFGRKGKAAENVDGLPGE